jgi:sialidase-1
VVFAMLLLLGSALLSSGAMPPDTILPPTGARGTKVFWHGQGGYPCIRTPSLVTLPDGTLLAFSGTRCGAGDGCYPAAGGPGNLNHEDAVMRRSDDAGATWSPLKVLYQGDCKTRTHGSAVFDRVRGRVIFSFSLQAPERQATMWSDNAGDSWSTPRPLDLGAWNDSNVGPGDGLQLSAGHPVAPGRVLFTNRLDSGTNQGNAVYFSDDGGDNWKLSPGLIPDCNEAQIVELTNGTLLFNGRDEDRAAAGARRFATSHDGGVTWSTTVLRTDLSATNCMGSFISAPPPPEAAVAAAASVSDPGSMLLYAHPAAPYGSPRTNGTVYASEDQGRTFRPAYLPNGGAASFGYSAMTFMATGVVGLVYETADLGCTGASCQILFQSFTLPAASG